MDETKHNQLLKYLSDKIKEVLSEDLGIYQIIKNGGTVQREIPSVRIEPPKLPDNHKFIKDSGIEAIISRDTELDLNYFLGALDIEEKYCIRLTQFNINKCISIPTKKLLFRKEWEIFDQPITTPFKETSEGNIYAQAIIKISVNYYQSFDSF